MHWLRRHWRGITGAALLVWQGIDWLLKWGEHVKFITEETQHLGEARKVIDFLANPPWWGPPAAIVCGLLLIWWDLKRRSAEQPAVVPAIVPSPPYTPVSNEPDPDMPIRDLFFFIRPDLIDDHKAKEWRSVGGKVMDKFSTGRLKVWGRLISADRHRSPLVPIDPKYWSKVEFSYWFLEKDHEQADHTWPKPLRYVGPISSVPSYCDLQVNHEQAESIWRQSEAPTHTPIWRAIAHVRLAINDTARDKCYPATLTALRQAALDGKIKLRGRQEIDVGPSQTFSDVSSDIPAEYWRVSVIGPMATDEQYAKGWPHTGPETAFAWGPKSIYEKKRYADLTVNMREIKQLWP